MLAQTIIYALAAAGLFVIGLRGTLLHSTSVARILSINVCGVGVFLMFVVVAYRGPDAAPDPVPHALVLTGIVVAISATALALALARRLRDLGDE